MSKELSGFHVLGPIAVLICVVVILVLITEHQGGDARFLEAEGNTLSWEPGTTFSYQIDENITQENKSEIINSFNKWNVLLNQDLFINQPNSNVYVEIDNKAETVKAAKVFFYHAPDTKFINYAKIMLYKPFFGLSPEMRARSLSHEIGHVLCLAHTSNENCLMYPQPNVDVPCAAELDLLTNTFVERTEVKHARK